jgi:hypothetical protein
MLLGFGGEFKQFSRVIRFPLLDYPAPSGT